MSNSSDEATEEENRARKATKTDVDEIVRPEITVKPTINTSMIFTTGTQLQIPDQIETTTEG